MEDMKLIEGFTMPPFARIQWASRAVKEKYEPMFKKACRVYHQLEKLTVIHGVRKVTTDHFNPNDFDVRQQDLIKNGLFFLPIQKVGEYSGFSSYHPPVENGKPWNYYGVIASNTEDAEMFAKASEEGDHTTLGKLLGYPDCCIEMLNTKWAQGFTDPVWQQAQNTSKEKIRFENTEGLTHTVRFKDMPWESNTLLRYFSLGPIFHVKCSLDCTHTHDIAKKWIELGQELKLDGMREMEMFLRMPMEWDTRKGIAYIRTPLFKASVNSVMSTEQFKVQIEGTYFPEDSAKGLDFPWTEGFPTIARNGNKLTME